MAWCNRSVALARMPWGCSPSISLAFAGGRQPAHARGWGGVDLCRPIVRWPPNWGHHAALPGQRRVQLQLRCTSVHQRHSILHSQAALELHRPPPNANAFERQDMNGQLCSRRRRQRVACSIHRPRCVGIASPAARKKRDELWRQRGITRKSRLHRGRRLAQLSCRRQPVSQTWWADGG